MLGLNLTVRDIEHFWDELNNKCRSDCMKLGGRSEQVELDSIMELKYKEERRFQRQIKERRIEAGSKYGNYKWL